MFGRNASGYRRFFEKSLKKKGQPLGLTFEERRLAHDPWIKF
jgi:hypothetical protein